MQDEASGEDRVRGQDILDEQRYWNRQSSHRLFLVNGIAFAVCVVVAVLSYRGTEYLLPATWFFLIGLLASAALPRLRLHQMNSRLRASRNGHRPDANRALLAHNLARSAEAGSALCFLIGALTVTAKIG